MPCSDVTEVLQAVVDDNDRLLRYRFIKRSCGQGVGADTLLESVLAGRSVEDILAIQPEDFLEDYPVSEPIEEFLGLKHLIALQGALEVLTGRASGHADEICAAAEVSYADGETTIDTLIKVDLVTEKIKSCGGCRDCGTKKKARKAPIVLFSDN